MDFKRDRSKPFTRGELLDIFDAAIAEGNELVAQLAGVLHGIQPHVEKMDAVYAQLKGAATAWQHLSEPEPGTIKHSVWQRLTNLLDEGFQAELVSFHGDAGGLDLKFRTNWCMELIAGELAKTLRREDGTYWNNVTLTMHYLGEEFFVQVQRVSGKTVKQQLNEAEARLAQMKDDLDEARSQIVELEHEKGLLLDDLNNLTKKAP